MNTNNIFVLANWTKGESRTFTSLEVAIKSNKYDPTDDVAIVEMELHDDEFIQHMYYDLEGNVIEEEQECTEE